MAERGDVCRACGSERRCPECQACADCVCAREEGLTELCEERAGATTAATLATLRAKLAQAMKVIDLYHECGVAGCEFHEPNEEAYAHECSTCDAVDRLRAERAKLKELP